MLVILSSLLLLWWLQQRAVKKLKVIPAEHRNNSNNNNKWALPGLGRTSSRALARAPVSKREVLNWAGRRFLGIDHLNDGFHFNGFPGISSIISWMDKDEDEDEDDKEEGGERFANGIQKANAANLEFGL